MGFREPTLGDLKPIFPTPILIFVLKQETLMKMIVTGLRRHIGAHRVDLVKQSGHRVTVYDLGWLDGCGQESFPSADPELVKDSIFNLLQ